MQKNLLITTCGTSLLSNNLNADRKEINRLANAGESSISLDDKQYLDKILESQREVLFGNNFQKAKELSAELNVIIAFSSGKLPTPCKEDQNILIHTQTYQGKIVAGLLNEYLRSKGCLSYTKEIEELNTKSLTDFKNGISSLISWCHEVLPEYKKAGFRIVFNINGGFKSLQGFMQTLGMFYADELLYIFEGSNQLLRIPRLPVEMESSVEIAVKDNLEVFRKLGIRGTTMPKVAVETMPESFLYEIDGEVELSNWGQLVWERYRKKIYGENLLPPLGYVGFSRSGMKDKDDLDKAFFVTYNERMDDLFQYFQSGKKLCVKRLDYKQLKGNPCPPSTHECDLSSNRGAWRIFGHEESNTFMVDRIGPGLH